MVLTTDSSAEESCFFLLHEYASPSVEQSNDVLRLQQDFPNDPLNNSVPLRIARGSGVLTDLGSLARGNGSSTAAGLAGHLVVGQSETGSGRTPPLHAALWIVP
jgi:hypothetical protein